MNLSVTERLKSAAAFHYAEYPGVQLSVSKLCFDAGVNRGNAYAKHSALLKELTRSSFREVDDRVDNKERKDFEAQLVQLKARYQKADREYKVLLNLCIEQMAEIRSLRIQLADVVNQAPRKKI